MIAMQESDPSELIREVFAQYGLAMFSAQKVEQSMILLLASALGPGDDWLNQHGIGVLLDKYSERTFGQLARHLAEKGLPADLVEEMRRGVRERNRLAHTYFWERAIEFVTDEGRTMMIEELAAAADQFEALENKLDPIVQKWRTARGITDDVVRETMDRMLRGH